MMPQNIGILWQEYMWLPGGEDGGHHNDGVRGPASSDWHAGAVAAVPGEQKASLLALKVPGTVRHKRAIPCSHRLLQSKAVAPFLLCYQAAAVPKASAAHRTLITSASGYWWVPHRARTSARTSSLTPWM